MDHRISRHSQPRRTFLAGLAGLGMSALTRPILHAQPPAGLRVRPRRIDIHHHLFPPNYRTIIASIGAGSPPAWTAEQSLAEMDKGGIQTAVISVSPPGIWFGDAAQTRNLARIINDYGAKMSQNFPGRLGLVRRPAVARHRRQPARDRVRVRHAQGRWHRRDDQLRRPLAGGRVVRPRLGGA